MWSKLIHTFENIVANPTKATITVGGSILLMLAIIHKLELFFPSVKYLTYLIPFIPPFFITRTAKRINQRKAEFDFVRDALPYVFVAFPDKVTIQNLLKCVPSLRSDSFYHIFQLGERNETFPCLPAQILISTQAIEDVLKELIHGYEADGKGQICTSIKLKTGSQDHHFLFQSVLVRSGHKIKWQGILTPREPLKAVQHHDESN